MTRLNNLNAEILEFNVKPTSHLKGKFIRDLRIPKEATIGGVIRNKKGIVALGGFQIAEGDKIVVCCLPRAIPKIETLFL